jgi:hypothetical protein
MQETRNTTGLAQEWFQAMMIILLCVLFLVGLDLLRTPINLLPSGADQYRRQIEQAFTGYEPAKVLLDAGTWLYFPKGIVMKDRAPSIGERGYSQTGDFSALIQRIQAKAYSRIILRNYHSPDFWYDHGMWQQSSHIRQAMQENYIEVGKINAVEANNNYLFSEISILEPRR